LVEKHMFLQLVFRLVAEITGCIQLKLFPCDNENLANAVKGEEEEEEEEEDRRILTLTGKD
jgi:hypothetical protein